MANPEHLAKLKEGVAAWHRWREANPEVQPDLSHSDLVLANLFRTDFTEANLRGTDLRGADLREVEFTGADLSRADLSGADLSGANLSVADLSQADLSRADLSRADLSSANLTGADLSSASTGYTTFADTDLSTVRGLETVMHEGPSSIGLDTIYNSKGKIPHIFLRGCGVPANFIENMAGLAGDGIEFNSIFISYSRKNNDFAERLHNDLQAKGVRCWKDDHEMRGGRKVHEQIDRAIQMQDKLLLILSSDSMKSAWVKTEIDKARKKEKHEKRQILFPIRLCSMASIKKWEYFDSDLGNDSAKEIRSIHIPDFTKWEDPDAYQKALTGLLRDLKNETVPSSK